MTFPTTPPASLPARERKTQIWLRPDQVDLLRTLLIADLALLSERSFASKLEFSLVRFCARRIDELLALLPARTVAKDTPDAPV